MSKVVLVYILPFFGLNHVLLLFITSFALRQDLYSKTNFFCRLHEQLTESEQAAQCYIKYIQDIYSCGVCVMSMGARLLISFVLLISIFIFYLFLYF